jgi:hypothetical protein
MENKLIVSLLTFLLLITSSISFAQIEVCKKQDTLYASGSSSYQWYKVYSTTQCGNYHGSSDCSQSEMGDLCLWFDAGSSCIPSYAINNYSGDDGCSVINNQTDCNNSSNSGCIWFGNACKIDSVNYGQKIVGTADSLIVSNAVDGYLLVDASNNYKGNKLQLTSNCSIPTSYNIINTIKGSVFPNPVNSESVTIQLNKDYNEIIGKVLNINGAEIQSFKNNAVNKVILNTSSWITGLYYIELLTDGEKQLFKVLKQ